MCQNKSEILLPSVISLYSINWLVFIIETESVYCAVRTSYITYTITGFKGRSVASLSPRSQGFDLRPVPMIYVVEKVAHGQVLLPAYFGFPRSPRWSILIFTSVLLLSGPDKAWEPPKALSVTGKRPPQNSFHIVCCPTAKRKPQLRRHPDATLLATYLPTYSMVQSPSWEANWFAASQEIPRILWNPKVHYRSHKQQYTLTL